MKKRRSLWQVAPVVALCAVANPAVHAHVVIDATPAFVLVSNPEILTLTP